MVPILKTRLWDISKRMMKPLKNNTYLFSKKGRFWNFMYWSWYIKTSNIKYYDIQYVLSWLVYIAFRRSGQSRTKSRVWINKPPFWNRNLNLFWQCFERMDSTLLLTKVSRMWSYYNCVMRRLYNLIWKL